MKKVLILSVLLIVAAVAWFFWPGRGSNATPEVKIAPATSKPDASNATFIFEDGPVTLKNGVGFSSSGGDAFVQTETGLADKTVYGDINDDSKNDAVVILTQDGFGSGFFIYVAAYVSGNVSYKGSNAVFIGDRISPQSISIDSKGLIKVKYLDRKPEEPFAAEPTVPTTKTYTYVSGELVEK
ncbi:hypothetical protein KW800_00365 [Candidatus Parcubacteria bacterium]|nr:hypothetical protein [Candidatus Parcubacteria bacterium]